MKKVTVLLVSVMLVFSVFALPAFATWNAAIEDNKSTSASLGEQGPQGVPSGITAFANSVDGGKTQSAAYDMFLRIDGMSGESTDARHPQWTEVLNFNQGLTLPGIRGAAVGQADFDDFLIVKWVDKSSPKLSQACAAGTHIPEVELELCPAGGNKYGFMGILLSDCIVTAYRIVGSVQGGETRPLEEVSVSYNRIQWTYTVIGPDGKSSGHVDAGWDLSANKPC
jgi:type VI secretion system secreted protein Hcp